MFDDGHHSIDSKALTRRNPDGRGGTPVNLGDVLDGACRVTKNKILPPLSSRLLRQASMVWAS